MAFAYHSMMIRREDVSKLTHTHTVRERERYASAHLCHVDLLLHAEHNQVPKQSEAAQHGLRKNAIEAGEHKGGGEDEPLVS